MMMRFKAGHYVFVKITFWDKPGNTCKKQKSFKDAQQLETQSKRERNNYVYYCHQIIKKEKTC